MPHTSFRQIKVMVDNELLSHLSIEALQNATSRVNAAASDDAATQFPDETFSSEDLDAVRQALSEELEIRNRSAA